MKRKTLYSEQYVDCEYDIHFSDILELIESCDEEEMKEIRDIVGVQEGIVTKNLLDQQTSELLAAAFKKYSYFELQERLDIKPHEL